jgi:hypothetical protein
MLAYYNAWFRYNRVFLDLIGADNADFIEWAASNQ